MFNIINQLGIWVLSVINQTGYTGLFFLSLFESAAIPIPSEVVLPFSGFLVSSGRFNFAVVVIVASIANLAGSLLLYAIGRSGGRWLLERYGKFILIRKHDLDIGETWFKKHGASAVFWGRLLPVVRTFISLPAGIAEMPVGKFTLFTLLGAIPWNLALTYIGFKSGEHWSVLHSYFRKFDVLILGVIIVGVVWYIIKKKRR
ncbi:DedA family protein [Candidatus Parcubacteria bacterium]|nr:DedA family protein [Candidatus Parcubacteria bacterium]